jgi:hypothetical protein
MRVFDRFPVLHMKILLADSHANYSDIFTPKTGNMNMQKYATMVRVLG